MDRAFVMCGGWGCVAHLYVRGWGRQMGRNGRGKVGVW